MGDPDKRFLSNVLVSLEAEKISLLPTENPLKSPLGKICYDHLNIELFQLSWRNVYKKILSMMRSRKYATLYAQRKLVLNARVSYHKWDAHSLSRAPWARFTKQILIFIRRLTTTV